LWWRGSVLHPFSDYKKGVKLTKSGITVEVRNGNLEKALRVLKKKVMSAGIVKEVRDRAHYSKPSEIKREKKKEGIKNYKKKQKLRENEL
jgi:small subunit ribosomal protein S21|tara:strand:+ start:710 stop:979 length:270 start_codon:yes stop_codon:yes gene_type:complete